LQQTLFQGHRDDLLRILTVLWRMAGLSGAKTIRLSLYLAVTRLLRPAEAATRRLIVVLAQKITVTLKPSRPIRPRPDQNPPDRIAQAEPAWRDFALADPLPRWAASGAGFPGIVRGPDREIDGAHLASRFEALGHALDDLDRQARRLARWTALRKRARERGKFRATNPLRPGAPADLRGASARRLKRHELFSLLKDAHQRAWWASSGANDTS